jgi:hypothetical protein
MAAKKHLLPKLLTKIRVRNEFIQMNKLMARWLSVWRDAYMTFKEQHSWCINNTWAAEARLRTHINTYVIVPESIRAVKEEYSQAVAPYRSKLGWDPEEVERQNDLHISQSTNQVHHWHAICDHIQFTNDKVRAYTYAGNLRLHQQNVF